ncbi:MAG: serine hydrolase [Oscillospiraceae bacterium]|nr:serine hydrolase [Oscillospiraceae bacterium]MDD4367646.1 serine hydrolase [Oscillospiraceae bacterium]
MALPVLLAPASAQTQGIDPDSIRQWVKTCREQDIELHSFMLLRHGHTLAAAAFCPYTLDDPHMLYSLSKSFTATAIGFARQEGRLSLNDRVLSFFPSVLPSPPCEHMREMRIRDLLTMSSGHREEPPVFAAARDWVYAFLSSYVPEEPGQHFLYNTAATYMLAAILQTVTGQNLVAYLRPRLFEPLGMSADISCEVSPDGIATGGFGFRMRTGDIARFGQFLLQQGCWEGRQLLSASWIEEACGRRIETGRDGDWGAGYGYQFWGCQPEGVFRGDGAFGQYCVVMPRQDMVLAVTAGTNNMAGILTAFWNTVLPAAQPAALPAVAESGQASWTDWLRQLSLPPLPGSSDPGSSAALAQLGGRVYRLSDNPLGVARLAFGAQAPYALTFYWPDGHQDTLTPGWGDWRRGQFQLPADCRTLPRLTGDITGPLFHSPTALRASLDGHTLLLDFCYVQTPFRDSWLIQFDQAGLDIHFSRKVGFEPLEAHFMGRI